MEEIKKSFQILKALKKTTYNSLINQALLNNIKPENKNIGGPRSKSFKKITRFVPNLQPKKSTLMPTPLKLNNQNKYFKNEDNDQEKKKVMMK